jgi:hypothetical protein
MEMGEMDVMSTRVVFIHLCYAMCCREECQLGVKGRCGLCSLHIS